MKKNTILLIAFLLATTIANAQSTPTKQLGALGEEDWSRMWTNYKPNAQSYYPTNISLPNYIDKNTTLYKKNTYLMQGVVYVINNAVLTIEPGTIIKGDNSTFGALVITKGSKIIANGWKPIQLYLPPVDHSTTENQVTGVELLFLEMPK